jgi:hypothetical protein
VDCPSGWPFFSPERRHFFRRVEIGRTLTLDGWGMHDSIRGGWVWNHLGRDCVESDYLIAGVAG